MRSSPIAELCTLRNAHATKLFRALHVWSDFHVVRLNVEHVVDEHLQLLCAPWSMVSVGAVEAANAKAKGSPSEATLRVHRPRAHLVEWCRRHRNNQGSAGHNQW